MSWRIIEEMDLDVFRNLSIDESLARTMSNNEEKENTLRFWRSNRAVVIGRFQCVHEEVNLDFCRKNGIAIARRFTGGGTVYHDHGNLNFSICVDKMGSFVPRTLKEIYERFIGSVAIGLQSIGIPANYDPIRSCIRIGELKITGTAGWLKRGVAFLHGTLLVNSDLTSLRESLDPPKNQQIYLRDRSRVRCTESKRDVVTNISNEVDNCPEIDRIKQAIVESIESVSNKSAKIGQLTKEEKATSQVLYQSRYSKSTWNLGTPAP